MRSVQDNLNAVTRPLESDEQVGWLDFSSAASVQSLTVVDKGVYQAVLVGSGHILLRFDGTNPAFPATGNNTTGVLCAPGLSPIFLANGTVLKAIAKAVGPSVYVQRIG